MFIDQCILFLFPLLSLFFVKNNDILTLFFLIMVSTTCLMHTYFDKRMLMLFFYLANLLLAVIFPIYTLFLPILLYDLWFFKRKKECLACLIPLLYTMVTYKDNLKQNLLFPEYKSFYFCLFFVYTAFAILLAEKSRKLKDTAKLIHELQDTNWEINQNQLAERKHLEEQQNAEINIATLNERNRIAREIHDNVGHILSRSIIQTGALIAINKEEALKKPYEQLKESLDQAMNSIRESVHDLHNESIDLTLNIRKLLQDFTFCETKLDLDISDHAPKEVKYCFISITKEALNNTIKHSNASQVTLSIVEHPSFYRYRYHDNGTNKNLQTTKKNGIGLLNMKDRVKQLNGRFHIDKEQGFTILITIPKEENALNRIERNNDHEQSS